MEHSIWIQTCRTGGQFRKLLRIEFASNNQLSIGVEPDLDSIFPQVKYQQFLTAQNCEIHWVGEDQTDLSGFNCEVSDLVVNEQERFKFHKVAYQSQGEPVLKTEAVLFKNETPILEVILEVDSAGKTYSKTSRILGQGSPNAGAPR